MNVDKIEKRLLTDMQKCLSTVKQIPLDDDEALIIDGGTVAYVLPLKTNLNLEKIQTVFDSELTTIITDQIDSHNILKKTEHLYEPDEGNEIYRVLSNNNGELYYVNNKLFELFDCEYTAYYISPKSTTVTVTELSPMGEKLTGAIAIFRVNENAEQDY